MGASREHYEKYEALAQKLGIGNLTCVVLGFADEELIKECLKTDPHLNNIRLALWDRCDPWVMSIARHAYKERFFWSLGQTVCVLKHVARYHIAGDTPPAEDE